MKKHETWVITAALAVATMSATACSDDGTQTPGQETGDQSGSSTTHSDSPSTGPGGSASTSDTTSTSGRSSAESGSESSSESSSESGSESSSSGGSAACWLVDLDCGEAGPQPLLCGSAAVCPTVEATEELDGSETTLVDPDALDCVVDGLRAGTAGRYEIDIEAEINNLTHHRLEVFADGTVLSTVDVLDDKCNSVVQQWEQLRGATYLDECLARATDDAAAIGCVVRVGDPDQCVVNEGECS